MSRGNSSPTLAMGITLCAVKLNGYSNACILEIHFQFAFYSWYLSALLIVSLCGHIRKSLNMEQWQQSNCVHQGLATQEERDSDSAVSVSCTFDMLLGDSSPELAGKITDSLCVLPSWGRNLQNFGPKGVRLLDHHLADYKSLHVSVKQWPRGAATASDCQPWCLHIFAAVATNISETRCDGSSQVWSQLMMREQLLEPLVEQSTCYGLFWFLWRICGCHSLEGVAWSRPISTRRNVLVFCRVPLTCSLGIHLERLPLGSLWVLRS